MQALKVLATWIYNENRTCVRGKICMRLNRKWHYAALIFTA